MNNSSTIQITLKGPRGLAELSEFVNVVNALRQCIKNVCRCVAKSDEVDFDVSDLGIGSAMLAVTPVPNGIPENVLIDVSSVVANTVAMLECGGSLDDRLDFPAIRAFLGFSSIVKKPGTWLTVGQTRLTNSYVTRIKTLIEPDASAMGSVTGRLEAFSIHQDSRFTLFPPVSGEEVACIFDRSDLGNVLKAVDHTVVVYGKLHYVKIKAFPSRVDVDSFEILPEIDALPTLLNACGSMHSPVASVQMAREIRDEW